MNIPVVEDCVDVIRTMPCKIWRVSPYDPVWEGALEDVEKEFKDMLGYNETITEIASEEGIEKAILIRNIMEAHGWDPPNKTSKTYGIRIEWLMSLPDRVSEVL